MKILLKLSTSFNLFFNELHFSKKILLLISIIFISKLISILTHFNLLAMVTFLLVYSRLTFLYQKYHENRN